MQTVRNDKGDLKNVKLFLHNNLGDIKMRMHYKNLIDKLLTLPDKAQAIAQAIAEEADPTAKNDLIKIKNKYIGG